MVRVRAWSPKGWRDFMRFHEQHPRKRGINVDIFFDSRRAPGKNFKLKAISGGLFLTISPFAK
jgi:hypothetical protein